MPILGQAPSCIAFFSDGLIIGHIVIKNNPPKVGKLVTRSGDCRIGNLEMI